MNNGVFNLDDLYIFEVYEKAYDDEYYDDSIDYYIKNTFFTLKDYCVCYIDDNKNVVDAITNKELKIFSNDLENKEEFIFSEIYRKINYYVVDGSNGIDVSRRVLLELWSIVKDNLQLENKGKYNQLLYMSVPIVDNGYYPKKDTMIYYSEMNYYDEYKEYRKELILTPNGVNNKNIIM